MSENRRLKRKFKSMQMDPGDDPKQNTIRVDTTVNEFIQLGVESSHDKVNVASSAAFCASMNHEANVG